MCPNIQTLFDFEPPATGPDIRGASFQFVRKLSGFAFLSKANGAALDAAIGEVAASACKLISGWVTWAEPKNRELEAAKLPARSALRFATGTKQV